MSAFTLVVECPGWRKRKTGRREGRCTPARADAAPILLGGFPNELTPVRQDRV